MPETLPQARDIIGFWRQAEPHGKCPVEMELFRIVPRTDESAELNPKSTLHVLTNLFSESCDKYVMDVIVEPPSLSHGDIWLAANDAPCTFDVRGNHLRFACTRGRTFGPMDFVYVAASHPQSITGYWRAPQLWKQWFGEDALTIQPSGDVTGMFPREARVRIATTGNDSLTVTWTATEQPATGDSASCRYHTTDELLVLFCPRGWSDLGVPYITVDHAPRHRDGQVVFRR